MTITSKQHGSTLLVALVMLVLMTLIAISAMSSTTSSVQVVGNAQFREEANAAGQQAIENVISSSAFKTVAPAAQTVDVNGDGVADYNVTFTPAPSCISYTALSDAESDAYPECKSESSALCFWAVWDVTAVVTDVHGFGAATTIHQGVRTVTGLTPAKLYCGVV